MYNRNFSVILADIAASDLPAEATAVESSTRNIHGPLYLDVFSEERPATLSDYDKMKLLEGKWESVDLYRYSFPFRFEMNNCVSLHNKKSVD